MILNSVIKKLKRHKSDEHIQYALRLNNDAFRFYETKEQVRDAIKSYEEVNQVFNYQLFSITFKQL